MNRIAFVVNVAPRWTRRIPQILTDIRRFSSEQEIFIVDRSKPNSIEEHLEKIVSGSFNKIVVVGGDGSLNRTIHFLQKNRILEKFLMGLIPCGTCNDFARTIGLRAGDITSALQTFKDFKVREFRVVQVNEHYFLNNCGFGRIQPTLEKRNALLDLLAMKPVSTHLTGKSQTWEGNFLMMLVANGPYFSGGLHFSKDSNPSDEYLDFFFVKEINPWRLLMRFLLGQCGRPLHRSLEDDTILKVTESEVLLRTDSPIWLMVDGELYPDLAAIREAKIRVNGLCQWMVPNEN